MSRARQCVLVVVGALVAVAICGTVTSTVAPPFGPTIQHTSETTPVAATAQQLISGRWSTLPAAPIAPRDGASVVWTGSELLVWGGASGDQDQELYGDGAAFTPATSRWRILPASPLAPRVGQTAVWTGSQMLIWGGDTQVGSTASQAAGDGAAFDPATNRWSLLPPAPISPRADAIGVWTGAEMIVLGGQPSGVETLPEDGDGAIYDPASGSWQSLPSPAPPDGHPLMWSTAIQADGELVAWSQWWSFRSTGPNSSTGSWGVDLFAYVESTGRWDLVPEAPGEAQDAAEVLWTGQLAVVRGTIDCGPCSHPSFPASTSLYNPSTNTWTAVPQDPLQSQDPASTWTGAALFSFDTDTTISGPSVSVVPGDASVYDPASGRWDQLPAAPSTCDDPASPVWTGQSVILYCPSAAVGSAGFVFTAAAPSTGTLTGGIDPCEGIPIPGGPKYAAGTVVVLRGTVTWRTTGPGTSALVLPTQVVASESVKVDQTYSFRLPPGSYVLVAHFPPPSNVTPFVSVTVTAGTSQSANIPNMCI